jgi:hypothetical protein
VYHTHGNLKDFAACQVPGFAPDGESWEDLKFVRGVDEICNFGGF